MPKFLDPYRKVLRTIFGLLGLLTLGLATYGAFISDIWLASTQWLLVSVWFLVAATCVTTVSKS